ncbi:hypothetical protein ZIOFF_050586 [Zingiber officinale]|uniref:Uncharacterized protein n=1 Tax=Zingiber officinale TaxID=94328 RepID=A0A8J5KRF9_ZINOF|nr:hypothetical protein ZIOFF_050586 [Zingiber officinale]
MSNADLNLLVDVHPPPSSPPACRSRPCGDLVCSARLPPLRLPIVARAALADVVGGAGPLCRGVRTLLLALALSRFLALGHWTRLSDIEEDMVDGFPFEILEEYSNLPLLKGKATVDIKVKVKDNPNAQDCFVFSEILNGEWRYSETLAKQLGYG